jgi:hypothetical protein
MSFHTKSASNTDFPACFTSVNKLRSMGYPEKDSLSGIDAGLATAKSLVSCAIGRVS